MAVTSPVFEKMFFTWPYTENIASINHSNSNYFYKFLQYLYNDNIGWMLVINVGPVLALAHKYGVNQLECLCLQFMSCTLNIENA